MAPLTIYTTGYEGKVITLAFDPEAKTLSKVQEFNATGVPQWLLRSRDGKKLYVMDMNVKDNSWSALLKAHDILEDGTLSVTTTSEIPTGYIAPAHINVSHYSTPNLMFCAHYLGADVIATPLTETGDFNKEIPQKRFDYSARPHGPHPTRQPASHAHECQIDPTEQYVFTCNIGSDDIHIIQVKKDATCVELPDIKMAPGDGPRHSIFSKNRPDGKQLFYVLNELANSLSTFEIGYKEDGLDIKLIQAHVSTLPPAPEEGQPGFEQWHAGELQLTPDHKYIIASNRAEDHNPGVNSKTGVLDTLAIYELDTNGHIIPEPTFVECGGRAPRHFALSDSGTQGDVEGKWIVVAAHDSDDVIVFERDGKNLTQVARIDGMGLPSTALWA